VLWRLAPELLGNGLLRDLLLLLRNLLLGLLTDRSLLARLLGLALASSGDPVRLCRVLFDWR
jgi:hypothetical protein